MIDILSLDSSLIICKHLFEERSILLKSVTFIIVGSGGGSIGRVVASDSRGPQFESSHQPKIYIEHLLSTVLKRRK